MKKRSLDKESISSVSLASNESGENESLPNQTTLSNSAFVIFCLLAILGSFSLFGIMIYLFGGDGKLDDLGKELGTLNLG